MVFSSWQFLFLFLPAVLAVFFAIPERMPGARKWILLTSSLFFYAYWKIEYVPLLILSIAANFAAAEAIVRTSRKVARMVLIAGVAGNLGLLGYYKYRNFFFETVMTLTGQPAPPLSAIFLPLAISFFTFTQIGYLVDVFRNRKLHYGALDYSLFVVFFPHLIAGPIVRHWEIIPQYQDKPLRPSSTDIATGAVLFLIGLFKKVLLADPAAEIANALFDHLHASPTMFDAWLGTLAFGAQIYFDFSGYSDMAIGAARMFSIRFPCNFDSPYRVSSIVDFWRRWHMTLTRFFREYVYFPLGGNRCGPIRHVTNILVTMLLSGLWHGAGWTFVLWGGLHGCALVTAHEWSRIKKRMGWQLNQWPYRAACATLTFLVIMYGWVLFRAKDLSSARVIMASMSGVNGFTLPEKLIKPSAAKLAVAQSAGGQIKRTGLAIDSYTTAIEIVAAIWFIAWFLPNSQQWLARYQPVLEAIRAPPKFQLPFNFPIGLAFGVGLFLVIRTYFIAPPSPFIYFNF